MTKLAIATVFLCMSAVSVARAGSVTYIYTDPQGTPLAEADAQGNITATYDYTPYGSQAYGSNSATGPGFAGHVNDADIGLIYMQARYYDPVTGRFAGIDPVRPSAGNSFNFNRFSYANNNSTRYTDPDGRQIYKDEDDILRRQSPACLSDPACAYALDDQKKSITVDPVPVTHDQDSSVPENGYDNSMLAGRAGLRVAGLKSGGKAEYGGIVLEKVGHYWYTDPVTINEARAVSINYNPPTNGYTWGRLSFHNHPYGDLRTLVFSPVDVANARQNHWVTMVGFFGDGSIRTFDPDTMKVGLRAENRYGVSGIGATRGAEGHVLCESCFP